MLPQLDHPEQLSGIPGVNYCREFYIHLEYHQGVVELRQFFLSLHQVKHPTESQSLRIQWLCLFPWILKLLHGNIFSHYLSYGWLLLVAPICETPRVWMSYPPHAPKGIDKALAVPTLPPVRN